MMNPNGQSDKEAQELTESIAAGKGNESLLKYSKVSDYRVQVDSKATMSIRVMHRPTKQVKTQYVGPQMLSSESAVKSAMLYLIHEFDAEFGKPQIILPE